MNQFFFLLFVCCLFLQRTSILAIQSAVVRVIPSVCLTVCLSHADIVSIQQYNSRFDHAAFTGGYDVDDDDAADDGDDDDEGGGDDDVINIPDY